MSRLTRRSILAGLAASVGLPGRRRAQAGSDDPIKIGVILALSGAQAALAKYQEIGARAAAAEINKSGGIRGKQLELVFRDDKANPTDAASAARDLTGNGIKIIICGQFPALASAVLPVVEAVDGVAMIVSAGAMSLTHESYNRHAFRICPNSYMMFHAVAREVAQRHPDVLKWGCIMPDSGTSLSNWQAFERGLRDYYPQITGKTPEILPIVSTKFGATDFRTQISILASSDMQGIFSGVTGSDSVTMWSQARAFGLQSKLKAVVDIGQDLFVPKNLGSRTPNSLWSPIAWYYDAPNPNALSRSLYEAYVAETGDRSPLGLTSHGHTSVHALAAAMQITSSDRGDAIIDALERATVDSVSGPFRFRKEDHQALRPLGFIECGPTESGWKSLTFSYVPGEEIVEPASPGKEFKL